MNIFQTTNGIIKNITFIIKTWQKFFKYFMFWFYAVGFELFSYYVSLISYQTTHQHIFMSYTVKDNFVDTCCLFNFSWSTVAKEHVYDFNPTNSLTIFPHQIFYFTNHFFINMTIKSHIFMIIFIKIFINIICLNFIH